jgi:hypothetical protein
MHVRIAERFNGPPGYGNGGYSCGMIAGAIGANVKVRLSRPVPLDTDLHIEATIADAWEVRSGTELIASAMRCELDLEAPTPPTWIEAFGASHHFTGFAHHNFPQCFVCGPARANADGLRIFAAQVPGTNLLAAPWRPDNSLADDQGHVRPEFIWAALDCPGYYATCEPRVALLGELAVRIDATVHADQRYIVTAWKIEAQGRKAVAGTALFDAEGNRCAVARATWVEIKKT